MCHHRNRLEGASAPFGVSALFDRGLLAHGDLDAAAHRVYHHNASEGRRDLRLVAIGRCNADVRADAPKVLGRPSTVKERNPAVYHGQKHAPSIQTLCCRAEDLL